MFMKLKGLFALEIMSAVAVIVVVMIVVEITPYLASSKQVTQIGPYNEKLYSEGSLTVIAGPRFSASQFNYSSFDPAILIIDLTFQDWQKQGYLSVYCNGRVVATFYATMVNQQVRFDVVSVSGKDWINPPSAVDSYTYGNEISFYSSPQNGYEGTFSYKISIRGSR